MDNNSNLISDNDEIIGEPVTDSSLNTDKTESKKNKKKSVEISEISDSKKGRKGKSNKVTDKDTALKKEVKKSPSAKTTTKKKKAAPSSENSVPEISETAIKKEVISDVEESGIIPQSEEEKTEPVPVTQESKQESESSGSANYANLGKEELCSSLENLLLTRAVNDIRHDIDSIKISFYKKYKADAEYLKRKYTEEGGEPDDFVAPRDPLEERFRELLKKYRTLKTEQNRLQDKEKLENLKSKYEIIEEIKELINREESINKTFHDFRELQNRWREIGVVPQQNLNDLWETYHHHVEKFYDYIKINKELRDLDLKKNMELKIQICEKAEALLLEPNIITAFGMLQKFHEQWREIGPVPKEKRTEIWERFREATSKINKKHQQYYQDIKEAQKKNLESKIILCEKVEKINSEKHSQHKEWVARTKEILELQKVWKTIGFAPKKENNKIYARFRSACDLFFEKKREFYIKTLEDQNNNLQLKLDLCVQAESIKNSTDWKKTSEEFIKLQKKWKEIGPVPRKQSDSVWKRFRAACDNFFEKKTEFFSKIDNTYENNLKLKEDLIREIIDFPSTGDVDVNLDKLQEFQRRWMEIGFVPYNKKEEIQNRYRDAINKFYDSLELDDFKKNILKFKNRLESILKKSRPEIKLRYEREKYMNKLQQLKNDIGIWENNIGFFSTSKNADSMMKDFEEKIRDAKITIKTLEEKITLIDELDLEI